jgi:hypothetical protein
MGTIYILNEVLCSCHRVFDPDHPDMIEPYLDDYINNNASKGGKNCASERGVKKCSPAVINKYWILALKQLNWILDMNSPQMLDTNWRKLIDYDMLNIIHDGLKHNLLETLNLSVNCNFSWWKSFQCSPLLELYLRLWFAMQNIFLFVIRRHINEVNCHKLSLHLRRNMFRRHDFAACIKEIRGRYEVMKDVNAMSWLFNPFTHIW